MPETFFLKIQGHPQSLKPILRLNLIFCLDKYFDKVQVYDLKDVQEKKTE